MEKTRKSRTVLKALEVLEELSKLEEGLTNAELSRRLGLHPSTSYRLLNTLVSKNYLSKENGLYRLGHKILQLKYLARREENLRQRARPWLIKLESETGFTTNLAILDMLNAVPIEIVSGSKNLVVNKNLGKPVPLHATAVGKCLLAYLPKSERKKLLAQLKLQKLTPKTITKKEKLLEELKTIKRRGFAVDDEEFVTGIRCVGAPIFSKKEALAAISVSSLSSQLDDDQIGKVAKQVIRTAKEISYQAENIS